VFRGMGGSILGLSRKEGVKREKQKKEKRNQIGPKESFQLKKDPS